VRLIRFVVAYIIESIDAAIKNPITPAKIKPPTREFTLDFRKIYAIKIPPIKLPNKMYRKRGSVLLTPIGAGIP
jgi:hypothetical protein